MNNFIKTSDKNCYTTLLSLGYTFLGKEGNLYCFINDGKKKNFDDKKVIYTNVVCL